MTFKEWLFGGIENPFKAGQWGPLHIAVMVSCVALIIGFYFIVKYAKNKEKRNRKLKQKSALMGRALKDSKKGITKFS